MTQRQDEHDQTYAIAKEADHTGGQQWSGRREVSARHEREREVHCSRRQAPGARLRRPRPVWIYGVIVLSGVALVGWGLLVFKS